MAAWSMLLMTSLMLAGCSVLGKRTANEPHYKVCEEDGAYEIRQYGDMPEGVCYAILLMNAFTPLIDRFTLPRVYGHSSRLFSLINKKNKN